MTTEDFIMTSADDAWETLRVGESLLVKGKLESVGYGNGVVQSRTVLQASTVWAGQSGITIAFTDWSMAALECDHPRNLKPIALSSYVTVRAVRTEDGLRAIAVWTQGGVPVPC